VMFPDRLGAPKSLLGRVRQRWQERVQDMVATSMVVENGKAQRVRLIREDDYKATYGPLISLISEKCNNDNSIDVALGHPMEEHRFVVALTFEKLHNRRARHLRAMVIREEALRNLPADCPRVEFEEHKDALSHPAGDCRTICGEPALLRHRQGLAAQAVERERAGDRPHDAVRARSGGGVGGSDHDLSM
jgi:hypothetical protein